MNSISASRTLPDHLVPERNGVTVWWSSIKRVGEWTLPRFFRTFTFMGNTELDLTSARMSADVSEIEIRCILGNVELMVPPDVRVYCEGNGFIGSFEVEIVGIVDGAHAPDAPILRVTGTAYLGSVTVKVMGTPGPDWKQKLKSSWDFFYS